MRYASTMKLPILFQRLESTALFFLILGVYYVWDFNLLVFVLLLFLIDVTMVGYAFNNRVGAIIYNLGHSYVIPALGIATAYLLDNDPLMAVSLIWAAHIAMDRAFGYGLKTFVDFQDTHLGRIGKS
jgi:hypothetical protein